VRLVEPGLGGQDVLVELASPAGCAGVDSKRLKLLRVRRIRRLLLPGLPRLDPIVVVADPAARIGEVEQPVQRRDRDLAPRREPGPEQRRRDRVRKAGLGDQQERLRLLPDDAKGSDDPALRRQQQRRPRLPRGQGGDLVREHPLEKIGSVRSTHADVATVEPDDG
jgi:hypothetical protein